MSITHGGKSCAQTQKTQADLLYGGKKEQPVILAVDEYGAICLFDKEGFSQEECGARIKIARTSVKTIYSSARRKIADTPVDGFSLKIEGGDYKLCDGREPACGSRSCGN